MVDNATVEALADLLNRDVNSEYIEYWRTHEGKEVVIREHEVSERPNSDYRFRQTTYTIRGTVEDVLSLPPGFMLEDVEEKIGYSELKFSQQQDSTEPSRVRKGNEGSQVVRTVDEKFVAFSAIDELESAEAADNAREPFRE